MEDVFQNLEEDDDSNHSVFGPLYADTPYLEELFKEWQFYLPSVPITKNLFRLNEELAESAYKRRDERLMRRELYDPEDPAESVDPARLQMIARQISKLLFHEDHETDREITKRDVAGFYPKFISERIYNHFAMLARSRHAKGGGTFSIQEELTKEIAGRLGLGLYLSARTPQELQQDTERGLNALAYDFQGWLVDQRKGFHPTTWGVLCTTEKAETVIAHGISAQPLILQADVSPAVAKLPEKVAAQVTTG